MYGPNMIHSSVIKLIFCWYYKEVLHPKVNIVTHAEIATLATNLTLPPPLIKPPFLSLAIPPS